MGDSSSSHHQHQHQHHPGPSRLALRSSAGGEIVEVQGGHIVRSIGRKDRHSKVCTAKGPRDRRVRLAAHTAIQFYDVQDRLGYDRPSKAVDWLIKKAKAAIDELAQLPPWHPTNCSAANAVFEQGDEMQAKLEEGHQQQLGVHHADLVNANVSAGGPSSSKMAVTMLGSEDEHEHRAMHHSTGNGGNHNAQDSSFLPPSLNSDAIADTIKSFFPVGASAEASSSSMQFHNFPTADLLSRNNSSSQDLRLSLQSFQDPVMLHHNHHQNHTHPNEQAPVQAQVLLSGTPLGFDGASAWPEHNQQAAAELSRFQRLTAWNAGGGDTASGSGGAAAGYLFNQTSASQPLLQQLLGHNQFFSQRGPLQSSNSPSVRAWMDPSAAVAVATADHGQQQHHHHHHHHPAVVPIYPSSMSGLGFTPGVGGGFSGFHIPARIQGDEEEHDGYSDKPSSASSDSRH